MQAHTSPLLKIAVIEASGVIRSLWTRYLTSSLYTLRFFGTSSDDYTQLLDYAPDYIVFPGVMDGFSPSDLLTELNTDRYCRPTVIVSTTMDVTDLQNEWDLEKIDGILVKPFKQDDILRQLDLHAAQKLYTQTKLPRAVIIDDSKVVLDVMSKVVRSMGFEVHTARDGEAGLDLISKINPQVVLVDLQMPGKSGFDVCRELAANPRTRSIPAIIISASADPDTIQRGFLAGAVDMLPKPVEVAQLQSTITKFSNLDRTFARGSLLLLEDNPMVASIISKMADKIALSTTVYASIEECRTHLAISHPDVIIIDLNLPDGIGVDWVREIRAQERFHSIPLLLVTDSRRHDSIIECLEQGANDYIQIPFAQAEFHARLNNHLRLKELYNDLHRKNRILEELAFFDSLTGILNRRFFNTRFSHLIQHAKESGESLGLLMVDLDHFKRVNDTHGHAVGDQVITEVASIIRRSIRTSDIPCRYGGEEIAVLLPACNLAKSFELAQRICETCANTPITELDLIQTVSIGVSSFPHPSTDSTLLTDADAALYAAKDAGRNRVVRPDFK